jgi:nitrile hydratase
MNGVHDMGGMHGFGKVEREEDEPLFHADWERRVFALAFCAQPAVGFNTDEFRHGIERIPPAEYLASSYYERWLRMLEMLVVEKGVATAAELASGKCATGRVAAPALPADEVAAAVGRGGSTRRPDGEVGAQFAAGDRVRARNLHPAGHTRLAGYVRGRTGVVVKDYGAFTLPDRNAANEGDRPEHCYAVGFSAAELWGPSGRPRDRVTIDLWESYLEPA